MAEEENLSFRNRLISNLWAAVVVIVLVPILASVFVAWLFIVSQINELRDLIEKNACKCPSVPIHNGNHNDIHIERAPTFEDLRAEVLRKQGKIP